MRISGTPSSSENELAYYLQAIAETYEKVGIMKSHVAKMEEEINSVTILRNELLANDLESNNGETDNFHSRNLFFQTTLSQSFFLMYSSRTPNPTRNDVFKLNRTGKHVLKLPQSSRNDDIN
jgi:regulator of replication initiation timing